MKERVSDQVNAVVCMGGARIFVTREWTVEKKRESSRHDEVASGAHADKMRVRTHNTEHTELYRRAPSCDIYERKQDDIKRYKTP